MTLEELSKLVQGKWIADRTFNADDLYEPVTCAGVIAAGTNINFVIIGPGGNVSMTAAVAFRNEIVHATMESCRAECDRLNKPADEYEEGADKEEEAV